MRPCKTITRPFGQAQSNPGRFRTMCTVMADTLANKTYELRVAKLEKSSDEAEAVHPKLSKAARFVTRSCFMAGLGIVEPLLSKRLGLGSVLSISILYGHMTPVSILVQRIKERVQPPAEGKGAGGMRPSISAYFGAFSIVDAISTPLYAYAMAQVVRLSHGMVQPMVAAISVVAATAAAIVFEYPAFRTLWKRSVLRGAPAGTVGDDIRGFLDEFKPLAIFTGWKGGHPAKSAAEYVGNIWGVIESHFLWRQCFQVLFAATFAWVFPTNPKEFVDKLFGAMALFGTMVSSAVSSRNIEAVIAKIKENNRALGLVEHGGDMHGTKN